MEQAGPEIGANGPLAKAVSGRLSVVLPVLFCLPFVVLGLVIANQGIQRLAAEDWTQGAFMLGFGALFAAIPLRVVTRLRGRLRALGRSADRARRHPDEPWLWREEWAQRRIPGSGRAGMTVAWGFALFWNAIAWPLATLLPREIERGNPGALVALLFPAAGVALLVWAVRVTLRWRRFGASTLELATLPGVLGGELAGTLHVGDGLQGAPEIALRLSSIRRWVTGSGDSRSTHEQVVWTDEALLPGTALGRGPFGLSLPVRFALPSDAEPSDALPSSDRVLWRLEACAELPGVDYAAQFEVPVFDTGAGDRSRTAAAMLRELGDAGDAPAGPLASGIAVHPHPEGGSEIRFPAGRHRGPALAAAVFAAAFWGITWVCHAQDAPALFPVVFGFFSLLISWAAVSLALGSARVRVWAGGVDVESRLPLYRHLRHWPVDEIEAVELVEGMRAGSRVYWDLRFRKKGSSPRPRRRTTPRQVPTRIADRVEAARIAALVARELGLEEDRAPRDG